MSRSKLLAFCRRRPHATEDVKWEHNLVFSVADKMFAVFDAESGDAVSFKTDPTTFDDLTTHPGIVPTPYLARHHWVHVTSAMVLPLALLQDLLSESHQLIAAKLPGATRRGIIQKDSCST